MFHALRITIIFLIFQYIEKFLSNQKDFMHFFAISLTEYVYLFFTICIKKQYLNLDRIIEYPYKLYYF